MDKVIISTDKAPGAIGPYNQAVVAGGMVYTSGQIPIDPAVGEIVVGGIVEQAHQSLKNVKAILEASGSSLEKAVKVTIFIKNMDDFATINEIYAQYFTKNQPARVTVEVARLPKDVLLEIDTIAIV